MSQTCMVTKLKLCLVQAVGPGDLQNNDQNEYRCSCITTIISIIIIKCDWICEKVSFHMTYQQTKCCNSWPLEMIKLLFMSKFSQILLAWKISDNYMQWLKSYEVSKFKIWIKFRAWKGTFLQIRSHIIRTVVESVFALTILTTW